METVKSLILRVTNRCNLHCAYCYAANMQEDMQEDIQKDIPEDMPESVAQRAVALCCPPGGELRVQFTGGEPLLCLPVLEGVWRFGRETGRALRLSVQTNATLLTPAVCRRLRAMECAVGVSLDGIPVANALRVYPDGTETFKECLRGIQTLGGAGIACGLTVVLSRCSAPRLGTLPDLALGMGNVTGVGLDLFRPLGRGRERDLSPTPADLERGLRALVRRVNEIRAAGIPFRLREMDRLRKRRACSENLEIYCAAQTDASFCVDPAGDLWPCSSLAGIPACRLGNIRDGLPAAPRQCQRLDAPVACRRCGEFPFCGGGCPAGRLAENQTNDRVCLLHRVLREEGSEESI